MTVSGSARAQAAEVCADPRLRVVGALAPRWREPAAKLCAMLGSMADADASARLQLVPAAQDVIVEVTLGDGRSTLRRVRPTDDLLRTVEALVAVPLQSPEAVPEAAAQVSPASATPPAHPSEPEPPRMAIEVGGAALGRIAGSTVYLSAGLYGYAGFRLESWLLAVSARWDGYQTRATHAPQHLEMSTAGVGLLLLHRLHAWRATDLEAGCTTWLLSEMQTRGEGALERGGNTFDVRMGTIVRLLLGNGPLRAMTSLDFELSPIRLRQDERLAAGLPLMPSWSLGLGVGVAWETAR